MRSFRGAISPSERPMQSVLLERMNHVQQHRGPDASGNWVFLGTDVGFGFGGLAIVNLEAKTNQTMPTDDDSLHLVL